MRPPLTPHAVNNCVCPLSLDYSNFSVRRFFSWQTTGRLGRAQSGDSSECAEAQTVQTARRVLKLQHTLSLLFNPHVRQSRTELELEWSARPQPWSWKVRLALGRRKWVDVDSSCFVICLNQVVNILRLSRFSVTGESAFLLFAANACALLWAFFEPS